MTQGGWSREERQVEGWSWVGRVEGERVGGGEEKEGNSWFYDLCSLFSGKFDCNSKLSCNASI